MAVVVLIVIGIVLWLIFSDNNSKPKQVNQHQKKADKEFEDMYFNGASGDDIDDF